MLDEIISLRKCEQEISNRQWAIIACPLLPKGKQLWNLDMWNEMDIVRQRLQRFGQYPRAFLNIPFILYDDKITV